MTPLAGPVVTAAQMRAAEAACGESLGVLMERAGAALGEAAWRFGGGRPVLIVCGPGNNGGDGYVAARWLRERGCEVRVAAFEVPHTDLARAARAALGAPVEPLHEARPALVLVDALFGVGLTRPIDGDLLAAMIRLSAAAFTIAADMPSGLDSDAGRDMGAVGADLTVAFGAAKRAHLLQPAAALCGRVLIVDIGCPVTSDINVIPRPRFPSPGADDHKYTRGMVAVVAGTMTGAATLGASAAARIAGYTVLCGKGDAPASIVRRGFAATLDDSKLRAMLIGPGLTDTPEAREKLAAARASGVALVLDAGALSLVEPRGLNGHVVTPHEGEFARLFSGLPGSKLERAQAAAASSGGVVVLKGADTIVAAPDGRAAMAPLASGWLATAGTGDVLAGVIAALLAAGRFPFEAACAGVWLHAEAARLAGPALIADDLPRHLADAIAACR